jgi:hypothetical protein
VREHLDSEAAVQVAGDPPLPWPPDFDELVHTLSTMPEAARNPELRISYLVATGRFDAAAAMAARADST